MAKFISILYCLVFWITNCVTHTSSFDWISKPVDLQQCEGDNVDLNWNYNKSSSTHVSLIHWLFLGTGNTLAGWDDSTMSYKVYPVYTGRVTPLEHHNAGIRLRDVTPADTGVYKLELGGPGIIDTTNVTVYNENLLQPSLEVDGDPKNFSMEIVGVEGRTMVFRVTTGTSLKANSIVFTREGFDGIYEELDACWNQTTFEYSMKLSQSGNFSIHINVTYPVCTPISRTIHINVQEEQPVSAVLIVAIVVAVCLLVLVVIITVIVLIHHRKKRLLVSQSKKKVPKVGYKSTEPEPAKNVKMDNKCDDNDKNTKADENAEKDKLLPEEEPVNAFQSDVQGPAIDTKTHDQDNSASQNDNDAKPYFTFEPLKTLKNVKDNLMSYMSPRMFEDNGATAKEEQKNVASLSDERDEQMPEKGVEAWDYDQCMPNQDINSLPIGSPY